MTVPPPRVRCPICQDHIEWTEQDLYRWDQAQAEYVALKPALDPDKRRDQLRTAYRRCPNPSGDTQLVHHLPWFYPAYRPPVVVGLVGGSDTGKTHLLAAMISQIMDSGLRPYGLRWEPLDHARHEAFTQDFVHPLLAGHKLAKTPLDDNRVEYVDALLLSGPTDQWPVVFFDIAGEDFRTGSRPARFMLGASALIFVVDPGLALGVVGDDAAVPAGRDTSFEAALSRIRAIRPPVRGYVDMPAAMVINKADRLRFRYPADAWMRIQPAASRLDPDAIRAESRDAYGLLHSDPRARSWLEPFGTFRRCTLHFASATGGEVAPQGDRYPHGVHPRRVLEPLVALLAMTGVLAGPDAAEVGI
jgi:hypothetical protein